MIFTLNIIKIIVVTVESKNINGSDVRGDDEKAYNLPNNNAAL